MERIGWIDFLRGISMVFILIFHTEVYYKEYDISPYYFYTTNAIILFYFISGYLFYRKETFQLKKKIKNIIISLLIPYLYFTPLLSITKQLIKYHHIDFQYIVIHVLSGRASWFIAALIVSETVFSIVLWISRKKYIWLSTVALLFFITYYLIPFNQHNYWQWQDALLAFVFLYFGYIYHQYEDFFHTINKPLYSSLFLLILIFIKIYEYNVDFSMRNIAIENAPVFIADTTVWLLLVISIISYIPRCNIIEWIGQHCIVYYFLCGGCPFIISMLMNKLGIAYDGYFYRYLLTLLLVYLLITFLTWLIYKYIPFITGKQHR